MKYINENCITEVISASQLGNRKYTHTHLSISSFRSELPKCGRDTTNHTPFIKLCSSLSVRKIKSCQIANYSVPNRDVCIHMCVCMSLCADRKWWWLVWGQWQERMGTMLLLWLQLVTVQPLVFLTYCSFKPHPTIIPSIRLYLMHLCNYSFSNNP